MVYEVFIYLYGMITLICKKYCDFNKEYHQTVLINIVFVWMDFGTDIKLKEN